VALPRPPAEGNGHGRKKLPAHLPRERIEYALPEESRVCPREGCGGELSRIGEEVSEQLEYQPASLHVRQIVRVKYACRKCQEHVALAEAPPTPIEKGMPGPGLLAHVMVNKFADHLPLHRQEAIFARQGVDLKRTTLCDWVGRAAALLEPLTARMKTEVLASKKIHTDDTPVPVQDEARTRTRTGRLWVYLGDEAHPHTVFDYTPTRSRDGPRTFLDGYAGYLQADAFTGYDAVYAPGGVIEVACWAHARRKFYDAQTTDAPNAIAAMAFIGELYAVEREAKETGADAAKRLAMRQERSRPVLARVREWLQGQSLAQLPKSPMGQAVSYALANWVALNRYTEDGDLSIDNNAAERALRAVAVGRKNYLFFGSDAGGKRAAIVYSLIASCKRHGIDPWAYLRDVLDRVSTHPARRIDELLPPRWKELREAAAAAVPAEAPAASAETPTT
jgi:transposase